MNNFRHIMSIMELSFKELKKRDVVNISDGSSFGHITDLELSFPKGVLTAIIVPGKRGGGVFGLFNRSKIRIDESNIIKIGGDVILVNIRCGETCATSVNLNPVKPTPRPPCPSPCPPPCPPPMPRQAKDYAQPDEGRIDLGDYSDF